MELADKNDMNSSQWLELFRRFGVVRSLYVSVTLEPLVAAALGELMGERTMEVLPALESISLDGIEPSGSARDAMISFISARQLSDRPVVVQHQKRRLGPKTNTPCASEVELPGAWTSNIQASVVVSMDVRDVRLSYRYRRISMNGNVSVYCLANGSLYELHRVAPYVAVTYPHIHTHHRCHRFHSFRILAAFSSWPS